KRKNETEELLQRDQRLSEFEKAASPKERRKILSPIQLLIVFYLHRARYLHRNKGKPDHSRKKSLPSGNGPDSPLRQKYENH
ncbi:MAG: hypothetical protein ACFN3E_05625, partial [Parascardovia denticolens]